MKAFEEDIARAREIANEVRTKQRNVRHAAIELSALQTAVDIAFKGSLHMRYQKRAPKISYFDTPIRKELTPEQKLTAAAKVLGKHSHKSK